MTHWDGLASSTRPGSTEPQRICILGATNRIQDIDEAILRRMPKKFPVGLPTSAQRQKIFKLILRDTKIDEKDFDLDYLVRVSAGMSGSDIKEACRDAAMGPVREYIRRKKEEGGRRGLRGARDVRMEEVRGLRTGDFFGKGKGLKELEELDEVLEDIKVGRSAKVARSRSAQTVSESSEEEGSYETESGEENFRDSAYQDAETTPVRR